MASVTHGGGEWNEIPASGLPAAPSLWVGGSLAEPGAAVWALAPKGARLTNSGRLCVKPTLVCTIPQGSLVTMATQLIGCQVQNNVSKQEVLLTSPS